MNRTGLDDRLEGIGCVAYLLRDRSRETGNEQDPQHIRRCGATGAVIGGSSGWSYRRAFGPGPRFDPNLVGDFVRIGSFDDLGWGADTIDR